MIATIDLGKAILRKQFSVFSYSREDDDSEEYSGHLLSGGSGAREIPRLEISTTIDNDSTIIARLQAGGFGLANHFKIERTGISYWTLTLGDQRCGQMESASSYLSIKLYRNLAPYAAALLALRA